MKVLSLILALFAALAACDTVLQFAGNIVTTGPQTAIPTVADDGTCTNGDYTVPYVQFGTTFTTAGTRELQLMAAGLNSSSIFTNQTTILIYKDVPDPTNPCKNIFAPWVYANQDPNFAGNPSIEWFINFNASTYYFVITSLDILPDYGYVTLSVITGDASGTIDASSHLWPSLVYNHVDPTICAQEDSSGQQTIPYGTYTWTQATTGNFDIAVFMTHSILEYNYNYFSTLALYTGIPTGNAVKQTILDPCNIAGLHFVAAVTIENDPKNMMYAALTAGQNYTIIFDGEAGDGTTANDFQTYGVRVTPSSLVSFVSGSTWAQPSYTAPTESPTCTADTTRTAVSYYTYSFTAVNSIYVVDLGEYKGFSASKTLIQFPQTTLRTFIYRGANTATPPSTCTTATLIAASTIGTPLYIAATPGTVYTIVVGSSATAALTPGPFSFVLWTTTGTPDSSIIPTTGTTSGSGTSITTGRLTSTTGVNTSTITGSISTGTTGTTGVVNSASPFGAGIFVALVTLFGLLL